VPLTAKLSLLWLLSIQDLICISILATCYVCEGYK
jgi:hypothetical protein